MPIASHYLPEFDLVVEKLTGDVQLDELMESKNHDMRELPIGPETRYLVDFRGANFDLRLIRPWVEWVEKAYPENQPLGAALVDAPDNTAAALLLRDKFQRRRIEAFCTLTAALEWLGLDPRECTPERLGVDS